MYGYDNRIIWVQGEAGAKSWLVAPNSTVLLMDAEANRFYIKSADMAGMPSIKTYEYKEVDICPKQAEQTAEAQRYTDDEKTAIWAKFEEITARLEKLEPKRAKKEVVDDE